MPHSPTESTGFGTSLSRRAFLQTAGCGLGWSCAAQLGLAHSIESKPNFAVNRAKHLIMIFLAGGPSQIDTWDPKPEAPVEYRNLHGACETSVPGIWISENLPRMAQRMHQIALVRSLSHDGPATHSAGQQLLMTGRCFHHNDRSPHLGSAVSHLLGSSGDLPSNVVLGGRLSSDFIGEGNGQTAIGLGSHHAPHFAGASVAPSEPSKLSRVLDVHRESWSTQRHYGFHDLGQMCLQARRLIEGGTRVVTINQFGSVLDRITWDMHANGGRLNSTAADYRETLCPQLDQALCGLLDDLSQRGLLSETVVVVSGEMGRSPLINSYGGRDHHTGAWSALLAGGPIQPGVVVGATDGFGASPVSRPVTPAEFSATLCHALGVDVQRSDAGIQQAVLNAPPISELF